MKVIKSNIVGVIVGLSLLTAGVTHAASPIELTDSEMDTVTAGAVSVNVYASAHAEGDYAYTSTVSNTDARETAVGAWNVGYAVGAAVGSALGCCNGGSSTDSGGNAQSTGGFINSFGADVYSSIGPGSSSATLEVTYAVSGPGF